jgi:hypothetical protein
MSSRRHPLLLVERLRYPRSASPATAWVELVGGIFGDLKEACAASEFDFAACAERWVEWVPFRGTGGFPVPKPVIWNRIAALLHCAEHARIMGSGSAAGEFRLEKLKPAFADALTTAQVEAWNTWLRALDAKDRQALAVYCHMLTGEPNQPHAVHRAPVAYLDTSLENDSSSAAVGRIGTLVLELFTRGQGRLAQHPADWVVTDAGASFKAGLHDAWDAALAEPRTTFTSTAPDLVWRALRAGGPNQNRQPVPSVSGRSVAGAFFYASGRALRDQAVDPLLVIVDVIPAREQDLAQFSLGELPVDGVRTKLKGLLAHNAAARGGGAIDTVVLPKAQAGHPELERVVEEARRAGVRVEYV